MGITIKDVAKAANVAPSTVSRVLSDNPRISMATKKRVRKAMKDLGYHPNINARSLANNSTQTLGIVMKSSADKALQNPFFPEVLRGVSSVAHKEQYSLNISTGETEDEVMESVRRMVEGHQVDGMMLLYSSKDDRVADYLLERGFPYVLIGKPTGNMNEVNHIDNDNIQAAIDITDVLIEKGHTRIAFVGGDPNLTVTEDRVAGYKLALQQAGIPIDNSYQVYTELLTSGGKEAVRELFQMDKPPTGLVVADDLMSVGMLTMLAEFGIRVPEDVSLVSFNNVYLSEIIRPALTTTDVQIFQLGNQAAKCLIENVKNKDEPIKRIIVPHNIVERDSVKQLE
ncbi:LacI family DNA-binding transcriptional regulator [Pontibacillus salicampi]|uniref:LacI family DNA-binding transcriptional regulator n=1 Tax=Pontibacillus salicampi TaxID=1449801 RepID=A0ABV6LQY8_9BACI